MDLSNAAGDLASNSVVAAAGRPAVEGYAVAGKQTVMAVFNLPQRGLPCNGRVKRETLVQDMLNCTVINGGNLNSCTVLAMLMALTKIGQGRAVENTMYVNYIYKVYTHQPGQ